MKRIYFVCLFLCLITLALPQSNPLPFINSSGKVAPTIGAPQSALKAEARILDSYGKLPLAFEANRGQTDPKVKFLSRTGGYTLFLTGDEAVLEFSGAQKNANKGRTVDTGRPLSVRDEFKAGGVLRMKLRNANPTSNVIGADELAGRSNYFIGNNPAKWRTNVPTYAKVKYEGIYPGINLVYYGNQQQLEYDFIVAPGANPHRIAFDIRGSSGIRKDAEGELVLKMGDGEIRWHKPFVYQEKNGSRQEIAARYAIADTNRVGFEVAKYDTSRPLYIDPLIYSSFLGGPFDDTGYGIAVDSSGNAYVAGTGGDYFPTTEDAFQIFCGDRLFSCQNAFVVKIDPSGSRVLYSTYLGSSGGNGGAYAIAVDSAGDAYVTGAAYTGFPTTPGAFQTTCCGAFVTKLNPTGSALLYSTYLGGSEGSATGQGIALDSEDNAYVTGYTSSTNFPTVNPLQSTLGGGTYDAFVSELNSAGSALVYSTYLGGSGQDGGYGIAVDSSGNTYITGYTFSTNFPITLGAFQTACNIGNNGCNNGFISAISPGGSALIYSTYLGGSSGYDDGYAIAVDSGRNAYVTGVTGSADFPVTTGAFQATYGGGLDAFVTEINPTGSALVYSTYLGGSGQDNGLGIAVDSAGNAHVTGLTESSDFPTINPLQPSGDVFVTQFNLSGTALVFSTHFGGYSGDYGSGIAVDSTGNTYVTGYTGSTNFPVTPGAFQTACGGTNPSGTCGPANGDAFVTKIGNPLSSTTEIASSSNPSVFEQLVTFAATVIPQGSGTPTGTVTFANGSTTLCNAVTLSGATASCAYSALPVGSNVVTATYSGDSNFSPSSSTVSQTVSQASTTLMLVSNVNPSGLDSPVTFTAMVSPQYGGQASGTVSFKDGATTLGSVAVRSNAASLTVSSLAIGTHSITTVYSGDSNFTGSTSNTLSQVVTKATTTTTLLSSTNPSAQGKPVTFTAVVSSLAGTPTGRIQFLNGTKALATLKLTSGSAKYSSSKLSPGANSITAVYEGDSNNAGSTSAPVNQFVLAETTTTLSSSPNPSFYGESVTFTTMVMSIIGAPPDGETVSFMEGKTVLGSGTLIGGAATFMISTLKVGTDSITAVYGGDSNFAGSTSKALKQVVSKATTTTALASSSNPSNVGQSVTFTASVTTEFGGSVTGTVSFFDGSTLLKTASLSGGVAKFTTKTLASGTHTITATYNGSPSFAGSSASLTQTVE